MLAALSLAALPAQLDFHVAFDAAVRGEPATGRLVVYLIRDGSKVPESAVPSEGPFWEDPQPMFGINVQGLAPAETAVVDDRATAFPARLSLLKPARYRAQAVLDLHADDSNWRREPGNLFSDVVTFSWDGVTGAMAAPASAESSHSPPEAALPHIELKLTRTVEAEPYPHTSGVELFELQSRLLSEFHHRPITMRAGVRLPLLRDPARAYAAVYEVPGFGGDHREAWRPFGPYHARLPAGSPWIQLRDNAFWIVLSPESGNGHTLFADSANNGPWARALVEELIPALETKYNLAARPEARLLRGHSSGGWSTLWLALTHPETFGAVWATSPDPVDFRRFQLVDIYTQANMYTVGARAAENGGPEDAAERLRRDPAYTLSRPAMLGELEIASTRSGGVATMSIRTENAGEEVLGPDNTSGQQWDSWLAVWGPRNELGHPAALYDPVTGALDHAVAAQFRRYDVAELVRREPDRYGPIFRERVRLVVGDQDTFFLNEAVALLKAEVDGLDRRASAGRPAANAPGYIRILPGYDHGSLGASPELQAFPREMTDHLRRAGLIPAAP